MKTAVMRFALVLGVGAFVFAALNNPDNAGSPSAMSQAHAAEVTAERAPVATADASYFTEAFNRNEVAAKMKFGAGPIVVRGTIKEIRLDAFDHVVVVLDDGSFMGFRVRMAESQRAAVAEMAKGQSITVKGNEPELLVGTMTLKNAVIL